jgi:hypothetical protein
LGEALLGVELEISGLDIRFMIDQPKSVICKKTLTPDEADAFIFAVEHNYWFLYYFIKSEKNPNNRYQMYIDELPIWGLSKKYK